MKNKFLIIIISFLSSWHLHAEDLSIQAKNITLDKNKKTTVFRNSVTVETLDKKISSEFAELNKDTQQIILRDTVIAEDKFNNIIKTNYAEYNDKNKTFKTIGPTSLISSKNYTLDGQDLYFDNENKNIKSDKPSILKDLSGNEIYLDNFEYLAEENIFKSVGKIKIIDQLSNNYEFSQIYIDTKKKEILGTDIRAILNNRDFKINDENDPRIFANTMTLNEEGSSFDKSVFTLCKLRKNEKCPPWALQAGKIRHDNKKKTIFYDNAVLKIYDIPIFYFPFLSHPDPSVGRRSGLLPPSFSDSKNLGEAITIPYFWAISADKNFTLTNKLFVNENPLFLGEYHQAFKNSNLLTDFGYTEGYKKTDSTKKAGNKSHFFLKYIKNFKNENNSENSFILKSQNVSDDKYLKLYKIKSNLVDYKSDILENSLDFTHTNEDLFVGINASVYESLKNNYDDKYEYILPEVTIDKNIFSNEILGNLDLQTNLKVHNFDTNKFSSFFVNDLDWESSDLILNSTIKNKFLGKFKNINYEARNIDTFKDKTTNEFFGAIGLQSEIDFQKRNNNSTHLFTPKLLLRLSPGSMRKEDQNSRLTAVNAFNMSRLDNINNFETGNTATLGFDYEIKKNNLDKFNFSVAQIINEKENKKLASNTSLDEKLSDLVGESSFKINDNLELNYQFALDQNYEDLNYNDINANVSLGNLDIDFNYIEENEHIGDQKYFKTKVNLTQKNKTTISFEAKRNLITNSSEFYDLSYEYINDCLRAGLVFRREFYNDSELESENSLMFNITLVPFGNINSPKLNK